MSRTEGPSSTILGHPMALPTLFVVGGWALLIGGYLPGQEGRPVSPEAPGPAGPPPPPSHRSAVPYPYAYPDPAPTPDPPPGPSTVIDRPPVDGPIRVTIEFPNRPGESASVVIDDPRSAPEPDERDAARNPSPIDPGVEPPPIPGPPPGFDPLILSPLMPDSVPLSADPPPILGGKDESAHPVLARTLDELPESFEPRSIFDRHRVGLGAEGEADPVGVPVPGDGFGDRAPAPPTPPSIDPMGDLERDLLATRPKPIEILPEPETDPEPPAGPPPQAPTPIGPAPVSVPTGTEGARGGLLGRVFGRRDRAERRRVPDSPDAVVPDPIGGAPGRPVGPVSPSDVLVDTDRLFRAGPPPEIPPPPPTEHRPIMPGPNPSPRFEAPTAEASSASIRADSGLVRKVCVAIPKLDRSLLQSRIEGEDEARPAAASSYRLGPTPGPDHDASIDPE